MNWNYINRFTFGQGKLLAVGLCGSILQSAPFGASLMPLGFNSSGGFEFRVLGDSGEKWRVEVSNDLLKGSPMADIPLIDGTATLPDVNAAPQTHRFYRALQPP